MESSLGFMAVFAVSGTVVFLARQVHKRLLSDFMKKIELELCGSEECMVMKKKVRFADDVREPSSNNKEYRRRHSMMMMRSCVIAKKGSMPLNRQVLYKGILDYRTLKGHHVSGNNYL